MHLDRCFNAGGSDVVDEGKLAWIQHQSGVTSTHAQNQVGGFPSSQPITCECAAILKRPAGKDQPLLIKRYALLVLNQHLQVPDGGSQVYFDCQSLSRQSPQVHIDGLQPEQLLGHSHSRVTVVKAYLFIILANRETHQKTTCHKLHPLRVHSLEAAA